jgi:hypothetical protein
MRQSKPYWSFWKVIFAGWIIRNPAMFFRVVGVPIGILLVWIIQRFR